jgi:hypothetical protein
MRGSQEGVTNLNTSKKRRLSVQPGKSISVIQDEEDSVENNDDDEDIPVLPIFPHPLSEDSSRPSRRSFRQTTLPKRFRD